LVCELRDGEFDFSVHADVRAGDGRAGGVVFGVFGAGCVEAGEADGGADGGAGGGVGETG